jgi:hypothetical protein
MEQAVVAKRSLRAILIVSALGVLTTACAGGKTFEYQEIDAIAKGPGFFTGEAGEATFDPTTGKLTMGDQAALTATNKKSAEIRRRRARARRRQEGATGN